MIGSSSFPTPIGNLKTDELQHVDPRVIGMYTFRCKHEDDEIIKVVQ
jgi:hypothetical protein